MDWRWWLVTVILLCFLVDKSFTRTCERLDRELSHTAVVLTKLLAFFQTHYSEINLDGLAGVLMGASTLKKQINLLRIPKPLNHGSIELLTIIKRKIDSIEEKGVPVIKKNRPLYYKRFKKLFIYHFTFSNNSRELRSCPAYAKQFLGRVDYLQVYNEEEGDKCFGNTLGSECRSTMRCWKRMVTSVFRKTGYSVTHGLLYVLLMEKFGCNAPAKIDLQTVLHDLACRVQEEFQKLIRVVSYRQFDEFADLLAEQVSVLSLAGFNSISSNKLFHMLVKRQSTLGCFGMALPKPRSRRLLVDSEMTGGCSSHESGLVASYLSIRLCRQVADYRNQCSKL